jgi:hypothetical protein
MIWYVLISLILAIMLWILLAPVILYVDTEDNRYYLAMPAIFRAEIVSSDILFHIRGWILFIPYRFDPLRQMMKPRKKKKEKKPKKKKSRNLSGGITMFRSLAGSIRVKKLMLDIDTDDFIRNAWLVPVFSLVSNNENIQMRVNYSGSISLMLDVRTRIGSILWILLSHKFKSSFNN